MHARAITLNLGGSDISERGEKQSTVELSSTHIHPQMTKVQKISMRGNRQEQQYFARGSKSV